MSPDITAGLFNLVNNIPSFVPESILRKGRSRIDFGACFAYPVDDPAYFISGMFFLTLVTHAPQARSGPERMAAAVFACSGVSAVTLPN
jgi:hypothetical protein